MATFQNHMSWYYPKMYESTIQEFVNGMISKINTEMTADSPANGKSAIMQDQNKIDDNAMLNYQDSINAAMQRQTQK